MKGFVLAVIVFCLLLMCGQAYSRVVCSAGHRVCGTRCYNPFRESCYSGTVCLSGHRVCGTRCYDPFRENCYSGTVCPSGHRVCGTRCYDPFRENCFGWQHAIATIAVFFLHRTFIPNWLYFLLLKIIVTGVCTITSDWKSPLEWTCMQSCRTSHEIGIFVLPYNYAKLVLLKHCA